MVTKSKEKSLRQRIKSGLKYIADRVFLRSTIAKTRKEQILLDKRLQYLTAKVDAYAEVSDAIDAALRDERKKRDAAVDARLEAMDAKLAVMESALVQKMSEKIDETATVLEERVAKIALNEFRQWEALEALRHLLKFDLPLPATRGWAASPDFLLHLYQHIEREKPKVVVELGSGVSTLVAAAALAANGNGGRLYSLDHEAEFSQLTAKELSRRGLEGVAEVHYAPLAEWKAPKPTPLGEVWQWYDLPQEVKDLQAVDLLVVDGPPQGKGSTPYVRYPAAPAFRFRLSPGGVMLLDDGARKEEKAIATEWSTEWALELDYRRRLEKGLSILVAN